MAWAEQIPGSGRWRGLYRDASGRRHTAPGGPFRTKAEAVRRAASTEDDARQRPGVRVSPRAGRASWGSWADTWWQRRKVEPGTLHRDESRRRTHLDPRWADVRLDAITRDAVQEWVDELHTDGMAPSTVANCYHLLSASLKAAVLAGKLAASPCVSIALPTKPPADERYLTWSEVEAITHFLDERDALLAWLLVGTGMRWGEAVGAHLHRLDLAARRLDVHEVWDQKVREIKPYPKGRQKRSVPLPGWLVEQLRSHVATLEPVSTCGSRHRAGSRCRSGLIVPGRGGVVVDYDSWRRSRDDKAGNRRRTGWMEACRLAKVGEVRIHDLRHTYASWLIQDGVSLEALSDLLGHSSIAVTMRYAHLADSQWNTVRRVLDAKPATSLPQVDQAAAGQDRNVVRLRRPEA